MASKVLRVAWISVLLFTFSLHVISLYLWSTVEERTIIVPEIVFVKEIVEMPIFVSVPEPSPEILYEYVYVDVPAPSDVELLAKLLYSECRGEPREGQVMVAQCVLDRLATGTWGDTLEKVILSPGQFAKPGTLLDDLYWVALSVLNGERYDNNAQILYFRKSTNTNDWHAPYLGTVGVHKYYGYVEEK